MFTDVAAKLQYAVFEGRINLVTLNSSMIIVCSMFTSKIIIERYNHDPQTIHKKYTDKIIAKYVGFKSYA